MKLADRVSESVIQIFHNAKGSIGNDIAKWTEDLTTKERVREEEIHFTYLPEVEGESKANKTNQ